MGSSGNSNPVQVGNEAAADQHAGQCPDDADDDALQHEDAEHRRIGGAHGFQDRDLSLLFEDHHDEGRDDVEGRDEDDGRDDQGESDLLHLERGEEVAVELGPVERVKRAAEVLLDPAGELERGVEVVDAELDAGDVVAFVEQALRFEEIGVDQA